MDDCAGILVYFLFWKVWQILLPYTFEVYLNVLFILVVRLRKYLAILA